MVLPYNFPCDFIVEIQYVSSVEFREARAGKDFFETCRSPEACCELTLQVELKVYGEISLNKTLLTTFTLNIFVKYHFVFVCKLCI